MLGLDELQEQLIPWVAHNFPGQAKHICLLGAMEELGELAQAHVKEEQGIRGTPEEHQAKAMDAIGDIVVYLADYCAQRGFDLDQVVRDAWNVVRERDWRKDPEHG